MTSRLRTVVVLASLLAAACGGPSSEPEAVEPTASLAAHALRSLPAAPGTPTFSAVAQTSVVVSWTASSGANSYTLQRAPDSAGTPGAFSTLASSIRATSYTDGKLTAGTRYWYRVAGRNGSGTGPYSAAASVTTLASVVAPPPPPPPPPPPSPSAGQYYVDCVNGSDSNDGLSAATPWKTLAKVKAAMPALGPGNVVAFAAGTTCAGELDVTASGSSSSPLLVTSYGTGAKPVIDPRNAPWGINVSGQYVTIDGLVVHNTRCAGGVACVDGGQSDTAITATEAGVNISAGHVTVTNTEIVNTGFGIEAWGGSNTLGPNNYIHDLRMLDQGGGFYGAVCWEIRSGGNAVTSSRCVNAIALAPSSGSGLDGGAFELYRDTAGGIDDNVFAWNWVENADGGAEVTCASGCTSVSRNEWHHNVLRTRENVCGSWHPMSGRTATGNRWENNTCVGYAGETKYEFVWLADNSAAAAVAYRNNVFVYASTVVFGNDQSSSTGPAHDHNLYWKLGGGGSSGSVSGGGLGAGDLYADPLFVNAAAGDYRLQAGSPARDAGSASVAYPYPSVDYDGAPVPTGPLPDIGAFEVH